MEQNNKKKLYGVGAVLLGIMFIFAVGGLLNSNNNPSGDDVSDAIHYKANVCVTHTNPEGEVLSSECNHNVLYTTGANLIRTYLGDTGGGTDEVDQISLCNATAGCGTPVAGKSEAFTAYANCGLQEATGTYGALGNGNWSIYTTFTSTCDNVITNMTRLGNTNNDDFAGNSFTLVTLQTNDQLTINWTISVS